MWHFSNCVTYAFFSLIICLVYLQFVLECILLIVSLSLSVAYVKTLFVCSKPFGIACFRRWQLMISHTCILSIYLVHYKGAKFSIFSSSTHWKWIIITSNLHEAKYWKVLEIQISRADIWLIFTLSFLDILCTVCLILKQYIYTYTN